MSTSLAKSAAVATAKTACCAIIGMAGGHFGMLLLGGLGVAGAVAGSEGTKEILKFASEKASEIAAEIGLEKLAERERNDPLQRVFTQSFRNSLQEIRTRASASLSITGSRALTEEEEKWFENWDRALEEPLLDDFDQIALGADTAEEAERRLRDFLVLLNAQGKLLLTGKKRTASHRLITFVEDELEGPPPPLVDLLKARLPEVLPPLFDEFLTQERNEQANKIYVNRFIDKFKVEYGPAIKAIKQTVDSIKQDTAFIPGIDAKVDILLARDHGAVHSPKRRPSNLPFASLGDLFKGREDDLRNLEEQLKQHGAAAIVQPASITGMGGIGKTRLAIEYALRHQESFSALLFVTASAPQQLDRNLALLSSPEILDLPAYASGNQRQQYAAVLQWLQDDGNWLLILDNADTPEAAKAVRNLVPRLPRGQLLITSRITAWGGSVHAVGLPLLSQEAAVSYLMDRTRGHRQTQPGDDALAALIAQDLGRLALALEAAAAYINKEIIAFAEYRARWQAKSASLIAHHDELEMDYPQSVAVTLKTTMDQLSPDGLRLLNILAWLAPDPIPRALLSDRGGPFAAESAEGIPKEAWPAAVERAQAALAELARFSLASLSEEKTSFSIHRLVQAVARRGQPEAEQDRSVAAALRSVNAGFPYESHDVRFWPVAEALAPHARAVIEEASPRRVHSPTTRLMNELGLFLKSRAEFGQAEPLYRRALAIDEASYGPDHPEVAADLNNLAQLLQDTNRLGEAEPLMRRALDIDEASYGSNHPDVASDLNNLAQLLQDTNRLGEAEPLMRRALDIDEAGYGPDHPEVATDLSNLAQLLQATNRLDEAEPLMRRALDIFEASYGPNHPNVATNLNNLAQLLKATNRLDEAEPLMRRALEIDEASYGPNHPEVAIRLNNLASLLLATNRLGEAEPLMRRALDIFEASYGPNHPNVATDLSNLAQLLQATNRLGEAEPLMRRALDIFEASYGPNHPNVATNLNNLAQLLQDTNRLGEAEPLIRRALAIDEASYGPNHPNVAADLNNLAWLFQATNRLGEAEPLMRRHLEIFLAFTRSTGHPHPHLEDAINNYGGLLMAMGQTRDQALDRLRAMAPEFFA
jgi:tetratricopeptide (TPR) repeat protein